MALPSIRSTSDMTRCRRSGYDGAGRPVCSATGQHAPADWRDSGDSFRDRATVGNAGLQFVFLARYRGARAEPLARCATAGCKAVFPQHHPEAGREWLDAWLCSYGAQHPDAHPDRASPVCAAAVGCLVCRLTSSGAELVVSGAHMGGRHADCRQFAIPSGLAYCAAGDSAGGGRVLNSVGLGIGEKLILAADTVCVYIRLRYDKRYIRKWLTYWI